MPETTAMPNRLTATASEIARTNSDMNWWKDRMPPGFRVFGFTDRIHAAAMSPTGRRIDIDGEFLEAIHAATR